ncbi:hypothetical protein EB796_000242 [Bugula neritina]|uniref:Uncharacterized protein n=1 Tax=Bugula neritina TaxID=10212 RepID=A0A7J7KTE1_BUGNE|nr:hypothetical protein EB796_000242 [Bugula neritina]
MSALPTVMVLTMRRIGRCPVRWKNAPYSTLPQLLVPRLPDRIQLKLATLAQLLMDSMREVVPGSEEKDVPKETIILTKSKPLPAPRMSDATSSSMNEPSWRASLKPSRGSIK